MLDFRESELAVALPEVRILVSLITVSVDQYDHGNAFGDVPANFRHCVTYCGNYLETRCPACFALFPSLAFPSKAQCFLA